MMDDTSYFLSCQTREVSGYLADLLGSKAAEEFLSAFVFWDAKRPITADLLRRLDLAALARAAGSEEVLQEHLARGGVERLSAIMERG